MQPQRLKLNCDSNGVRRKSERRAQNATQELVDKGYSVCVPQDRPLSAGETLGCTAPSVKDDAADAILFVADGRFHLEALMIANPTLPAYKCARLNASAWRGQNAGCSRMHRHSLS